MKPQLKIIISLSACLLLLTSISHSEQNFTKNEEKTSTSSSYSLNSDSMNSMEQQLKAMLKKKLLQTPKIDPDKALPPIVLKENIEPEDDKQPSKNFFDQLILAAKERTLSKVRYDGSYRYISYPMGDVAPDRGVCTDVVIRSYRKLGVDLQQLVHEDIKDNFHLYPSRRKWGNTEPDPNIDHRRVYNLQVFFERYAESLPITFQPKDYQPGDLVTWKLGPKMPHIGIVVDEYSEDYPEQHLIVHNIGAGPKQEDILFSFEITGHYRYKPGTITTPVALPTSTMLVKKEKSRRSPRVNSIVEAAFFLLP
jgi:uncharacterized protein YijF (DUF1287 family)